MHAEAGEAADVKAKSSCGTMAACSASIIVRNNVTLQFPSAIVLARLYASAQLSTLT